MGEEEDDSASEIMDSSDEGKTRGEEVGITSDEEEGYTSGEEDDKGSSRIKEHRQKIVIEQRDSETEEERINNIVRLEKDKEEIDNSRENNKKEEEMSENSKEDDDTAFPQGTFGVLPCASSTPLTYHEREESDTNDEISYCSCKKIYDKKDRRIMIECSGKKCPGKNWFHLKCAGLKRTPPAKKKWYCERCVQD